MAQRVLALPVSLLRRKKVRGRVGPPPAIPIVIILVAVVFAIFGDLIAPYPPTKQDLPNRLAPPAFVSGGSWDHPLGTDRLGRDVLSRVIVGSRISMEVAALALALAALVGTVVGLMGAWFRGWVDAVLGRITDSIVPIPVILIGLLLAVIYGPSFTNVVAAIVVILWSRYARVIRGEALGVAQRDFVLLARSAGASWLRIMVRHLFPNVFHTLVVMVTLQVGSAILIEASLSFLGAGIPPPVPSWGRMVSDGRNYVDTAWWLSVMPGAAIMMVVLSFNLFGDWLRDRLDPKLRQL